MKLSSVASYLLTLLAAVIVYSVLSGKRVPFIGSDRAAFYVLFFVGFFMSMSAGFRDLDSAGKWLLPDPLIRMLMRLGVLCVVVLVLVLFRVRFPMIATYRQAVISMAVLIGVKWIMVHAYLLTHLFSKTSSTM